MIHGKELYLQVMQLLKPMGDKLGPMMLQFEYLNKQKMPSQMDFQIQLGSFLKSIKTENSKLALEIRNPNYLNKSYFDFINEHKLIHVFLHGYYMPPVWHVYNKFHDLISGTVIIRLHGPDRQGIEEKTGGDWSRIIEPRDDELERIVEILKDLLGKEVDIFLNVNNHYEGSAPLTINKIKKLLGE